MSILKRRNLAAWFTVGALTLLVTVSNNAMAQAPAVDPEAVRILKQMTDFIDNTQQFTVQLQNIIEEEQFSGHRVDYDLSANVIVKRPNKIRATHTGGLMNQHFYYDGSTLTLYNPIEKIFSTKTAPDTIEKTIDFARETLRILLPAADLIYHKAFSLMMQDVTLAVVVGKAEIGGVKCNHLLFSRPGVDFQIWVAEGKQPFPHKYVVTETASPSKLSITTFLREWNIAPAVDDAQFNFVPPQGAQVTEFVPFKGADGSVQPLNPQGGKL